MDLRALRRGVSPWTRLYISPGEVRPRDPTTACRLRAGRRIHRGFMANTERALADEAGGPVAQLLPVPQDGGEGGEGDPLAGLKSDIKDAKGSALLVETTSSRMGRGQGGRCRHRSDRKQSRLGPMPPDSNGQAGGQRFLARAGRCGRAAVACSSMTLMALRSEKDCGDYHMGVVVPHGASSARGRIEREIQQPASSSQFDGYARDMVSRAASVREARGGRWHIARTRA